MSDTRTTFTAEAGTLGHPGSQYHCMKGTLTETRYGWRCELLETWGSNQGFLEEHGRQLASGRGATPHEAVAAAKGEGMDVDMPHADVAATCARLLRQAEDDED